MVCCCKQSRSCRCQEAEDNYLKQRPTEVAVWARHLQPQFLEATIGHSRKLFRCRLPRRAKASGDFRGSDEGFFRRPGERKRQKKPASEAGACRGRQWQAWSFHIVLGTEAAEEKEAEKAAADALFEPRARVDSGG